MFNFSSWNNLVRRDAVNSLVFEFLEGENNTKSHTDWQSRWNCDGNQIQKFYDQVSGFNYTNKFGE